MMTDRSRRILDMVEDLVSDFLYYDRKNDEDLPLESMEQAMELDEVTADQVIERFAVELKKQWRY